MIMDDPDFFPDGNIMPDPSADMFVLGPFSNKTSSQSQMSPHTSQSGASSPGDERFPIQLEFRHSSVSGSHASSHTLQGLSSTRRPTAMGENEDLFGEDLTGLIDCGFKVDGDGNITEFDNPISAMVDEPDLPPMSKVQGLEGAPADQLPQLDEVGNVFMMDEQPLPEADALPARPQQVNLVAVVHDQQNERPAPSHNRKQRKVVGKDQDNELPRKVIEAWQKEYLDNCCTQKPHPVSVKQAKKNAIHLTFGLGIANIGQSIGIPTMIHPLAAEFSGDSLFTAYTGLTVLDGGNRKRSRSVKDLQGSDDQERRVRPRLEEDGNQQGRGLDMENMLEVGQQPPSEIGREAPTPFDDHPSSAMPWNRGSSQMPGSSIQKGNSAQLGRELSSPLGGRSNIQDIIRYSSDADMGGMDFGAGGLHSAGLSLDGMSPPGLLKKTSTVAESKVSTQVENQYTREALDREGQNFLSFIDNTVRENGERRHDEDFDQQRKWVDFNDMFMPDKTDRATAAQAFYHVLTLVTKGNMVVEQDDEGKKPYGGIHVGIKLSHGA